MLENLQFIQQRIIGMNHLYSQLNYWSKLVLHISFNLILLVVELNNLHIVSIIHLNLRIILKYMLEHHSTNLHFQFFIMQFFLVSMVCILY